MILSHAHGRKQEIEDLLIKACNNMSVRDVRAWMDHQFDADHMFCIEQNDMIVSILQYHYVPFQIHGQSVKAANIVLTATHPDYPQRKLLYQLFDAAYEKFQSNVLVILTYTETPRLWQPKKFERLSNSKMYWMKSNLNVGNSLNVHTNHQDLYPLYRSFIDYFDGSIQLSKDSFDEFVAYLKQRGKKLISCDTGFAFYEKNDQVIEVHPLIYTNSAAVCDMMAYLSTLGSSLSLTISAHERLERILPLEYPKEKGELLYRVTQPNLLKKWLGEDPFEGFDQPSWNYLV